MHQLFRVQIKITQVVILKSKNLMIMINICQVIMNT